jgi:hypothetical protein
MSELVALRFKLSIAQTPIPADEGGLFRESHSAQFQERFNLHREFLA